MNRTEYGNAIRELLGLDIDVAAYLPADDTSYGFDNVSSGLQVSPTLVEAYITAASKISRLALGHDTAPARKVYHVREDYAAGRSSRRPLLRNPRRHVDPSLFPADGEYSILFEVIRTTVGSLVRWR